MCITRHGTQNAVQSVFITLGRGHRLLHVRERNQREQEIQQYTMDLLSMPDYNVKKRRPGTVGEWDRIAEKMMLTFEESKHPVFRVTSPLSRGVLKSKGGGKLSIHCCADLETI